MSRLLARVIDRQVKPVWKRGVHYFVCIVMSVWCVAETDLKARELIQNGSFESDPDEFGRLRTEWDDAPGSGNDIGFGLHDYPFFFNGQSEGTSSPGGFGLPPGATDPSFTGTIGPLDGGRYYGFRWGVWNGDGFLGSATQIVQVSPHAGKSFGFSAWLASRAGVDSDYALVWLEFFDELAGVGNSLGMVTFDGNDPLSPFIAGSLNLNGLVDPMIPATQDNWTLYQTTGTIPVSAQSARVVIQGATVSGPVGDDGFVDLVSLQVIPEPGTLRLGGVLLALAVGWTFAPRCARGSGILGRARSANRPELAAP